MCSFWGIFEEGCHLCHNNAVLIQSSLHQGALVFCDIMALFEPFFQTAIAGYIQGREIGLFENGDRFAHGFG